jgi:hypothetical protein
MSDYEPTSPRESPSSDPESAKTSGATVVDGSEGAGSSSPLPPISSSDWLSSSDWSASAAMAGHGRRPSVRRSLSNMRRRAIVAAALIFSVTGLFVGLGASSSAGAAESVAASSPTGHLGSGSQGSDARSGPAAGGSSGTVGSVSKSSFTLTTSAGQLVTVDEASSAKYEKGASSASKSAVIKGEHVLVLGTVSSTTIKATEVLVQTTGGGSKPSTAATVVPFQRGVSKTSKQVGQITTRYSEGSGTIVSGTTANKATEAALTAHPGGIVDRVVKLGNGEYEVHTIGVNWPHHVFVNQDFKVVGAN